MPGTIPQALHYIVDALSSLYLAVFLLRIGLPFLHADFHNPLAQGIFRLTAPLVIPMRRLVPPIGKLDSATVIVAFAIQYTSVLLVMLIYSGTLFFGAGAAAGAIALTALVKLVMLSVNIFAFAIVIRVVLSWIAPGVHNPATAIISTLSEPVLRPLRRIIPSMGGFDLTPILATIGLLALNIVIGGFKPLPY